MYSYLGFVVPFSRFEIECIQIASNLLTILSEKDQDSSDEQRN